MSPWDEIRNQCPKLYPYSMDFECGLGWMDLIRDLSLKIEEILQKDPELADLKADQVKEKYGVLRFYMSSQTDEITSLIQDAVALSTQTCEICGSSGKMRGTHWYEVRCDNCYKGEK
jgi:hypothetical protein